MAKDVIGEIIVREGGAMVTNDPADGGGRTQYGISKHNNPQAWADGKVTEAEARAIYEQKYLVSTGIIKIQDKHLMSQMLDYCVVSGPGPAIQKLQAILGVTVDGVIGPQTLTALATADPKTVNNKLVVARVLMICKIVQRNVTQVRFLLGWCDRALSFLR